MPNTPSCTLCNGASTSQFHDKLRYSDFAKIYKCKDCSLIHLYPRLSALQLEQYYLLQYRNDYESISVDERFARDLPEAKVRLDRINKEFP